MREMPVLELVKNMEYLIMQLENGLNYIKNMVVIFKNKINYAHIQ